MPVQQIPQVSRVEEICGIFMRAECVAKRIERIDDGMIVPAINQLRYAGHHFVKYSARIDPDESHDDKCINHCKRSIYDAYEAGITYCLLEIKQFQQDYRRAVITDVFSDYADCCAKANEANALVNNTPEDLRPSMSGQAETFFEDIFVYVQRLPAIRQELNKKVRKDLWTFYIVLATFVVTCFGVGYTIWKDPPGGTSEGSEGQTHTSEGSHEVPLLEKPGSTQ